MNDKSPAPRTLKNKLKFIGPGIVFAAFAIGSGELILSPRSGAMYGFALLWVSVVTLLFKATYTDGLARLTVATGDDIFVALGKIPGPKRWAQYFIMAVFLMEMLGYGGIALAAGTAIYGLFPEIPMRAAGFVSILMIPVILYRGSYKLFEKVVMGMTVILVLGAIYSVFNVTISPGEMARGLIPSIPDGSVFTIMSLMGWIGAGTTTLLYSTWAKEKIGKVEDEEEYRSWISTVRIDYVVSYSLILIVSLSFLALSVYALHPNHIIPAEKETMLILSKMLAEIPYGPTIFLVTAFFTLFTTVLSGVDGKGRAFASTLASISPRFGNRLKVYRVTIGIYLAIMISSILFGEPVQMIRMTAAVVSIAFGLLGFMLLYLDTKLPEYAKGSWLWRIIILIGSLIFTGTAAFKLLS